jgi:hypothetical protein
MHRTLIILSSAATAVLITGCGDSAATPDSNPAPVDTVTQTQPVEPAANVDEVVKSYLEAVAATDDPEAMRDGLEYAAEGSVAYVYLEHRANIAEASLDGGFPLDAYKMTEVSDGFEVCIPNDRESCGLFNGFKTVHGKVSDLMVDGEEPGPRLSAGNGDVVQDGGVDAEFLTAYDAIAGSGLWVTVRVSSSSEAIDLFLFESTYRAQDGKQRQVTETVGAYELGPDSNAMLTLVFAGVEPGGKVTLSGMDSDDFDEFSLEIQVG